MNQPNPAVPDAESRSFVTDEPRTDLISSKPAGHRKLWAGVATAAVMAVVGVGALNAPTWFPERTTAAATVSDVPAADAAAGTGTNDTGPGPGTDPAGPAVDVPAADAPAAEIPAPIPTRLKLRRLNQWLRNRHQRRRHPLLRATPTCTPSGPATRSVRLPPATAWT